MGNGPKVLSRLDLSLKKSLLTSVSPSFVFFMFLAVLPLKVQALFKTPNLYISILDDIIDV